MDQRQLDPSVAEVKPRRHGFLTVMSILLACCCLFGAGKLIIEQYVMESMYAEPLPTAGVISTPSESPQPDPVPVVPSSTPTVSSSATALPSAAPSPTLPSVTAIAPEHIWIPKTDHTAGVDTVVLTKPSEDRFNSWLKKKVSSFGVPEKTDIDPVSGKALGDNRFAVTSWWSDGPKVGELGTNGALAIILGHTQVKGYGVFNEIGAMVQGDQVIVAGKAGTTPIRLTTLKVVDQIDKTDETALVKVLQNAPEGAIAALVTCSGIVPDDPNRQSHPQNTVVFLGLAPVQGSGM